MGVDLLDSRFTDFLDPWGNRVELTTYTNIQYTKADHILKGMGLGHLEKTPKAIGELAKKGHGARAVVRRPAAAMAAGGCRIEAPGGSPYIGVPYTPIRHFDRAKRAACPEPVEGEKSFPRGALTVALHRKDISTARAIGPLRSI